MDPDEPYYSRTSRKDCNSHTLPTLVNIIVKWKEARRAETLARTSIEWAACSLYHQIQYKCEEILALGNWQIVQKRRYGKWWLHVDVLGANRKQGTTFEISPAHTKQKASQP